MGSLSARGVLRAAAQVVTVWNAAGGLQRALAGIIGIGIVAAVVALAVTMREASSAQLQPPPGVSHVATGRREDATGRGAPPPDSPSSAHSPDASLIFKPFSSLQRAATWDVEQRLTEAIASFRDVARPRVLLNPAVESPFGHDSTPASALVIVGVREGGCLTRDVIGAIAECAALSGAPLEHVRVVSEAGVPLFGDGAVLARAPVSGVPDDAVRTPEASSGILTEDVSGALMATPSQQSAPPQRPLWPLVGAAALGAGLLGGFALARRCSGRVRMSEDAGGVLTASSRMQSTLTLADGSAPQGRASHTAERVGVSQSPLVGLTSDELLAMVEAERPAVAARLLEGADAEAAAAALQALPEAKRAAVCAVARSGVRPWRPARAALYGAAMAAQRVPRLAGGAEDAED